MGTCFHAYRTYTLLAKLTSSKPRKPQELLTFCAGVFTYPPRSARPCEALRRGDTSTETCPPPAPLVGIKPCGRAEEGVQNVNASAVGRRAPLPTQTRHLLTRLNGRLRCPLCWSPRPRILQPSAPAGTVGPGLRVGLSPTLLCPASPPWSTEPHWRLTGTSNAICPDGVRPGSHPWSTEPH